MNPRLTKTFIVVFILGLYAFWLFLFKDFLTGAINVNIDAASTYGVFKYFYNNLFNGIVPLWEPYVYLGRPHIHLALTGVMNILILPITLLHFAGIDYYQLYCLYLACYLLLGIWGFFLLSKMILKHDSYALIAVCFLLFSGLPAMLFNQIFIVMLFVPAVWFFVFFLKFFKDFRVRSFWGLVCTSMVMAVSYLPFYFVCVFFSFLILYSLLFWGDFLKNLKAFAVFIRSHGMVTALGVAFVLIAFIPLFLFKVINSTGEILSPARHACTTVTEQCQNKSEMSFDEVAFDGTFGERYAGGTLFAHLDKFNFNDDSFLYVPTFAFIILLMAAGTVMDRKRLIVFGTAGAVLIISLGAATPVYRVLFEHIFFFKYFRNLFFFAAFLIPLVILFSVAQFKSLYEQMFANPKDKIWWVILIVVGHVLFFGLLSFQGNIIPATYALVFLSLAFFVFLVCGYFHRRPGFLFLACILLILVEPVSVFAHYRGHTARSDLPFPKDHAAPRFEYTRPAENMPTQFGQTLYAMFIQLADFRDASGAVNFQPDFLNPYVFEFYNNVPADQQKRFLRSKVAIYDVSDGTINQNSVIEPGADSTEFKAVYFDVNSLTVKTHFNSPKFLVYRDAYSVYWKAFVNGEESKVQLAESAFKGIAVSAGENVVKFRYMPPGGGGIYIFVLVTMLAAFGLLGVFYFKPQSRGGQVC